MSAPALGLETTFPLDHATQQRFLEGLDDIGITLRYADDIAAYEANRREDGSLPLCRLSAWR